MTGEDYLSRHSERLRIQIARIFSKHSDTYEQPRSKAASKKRAVRKQPSKCRVAKTNFKHKIQTLLKASRGSGSLSKKRQACVKSQANEFLNEVLRRGSRDEDMRITDVINLRQKRGTFYNLRFLKNMRKVISDNFKTNKQSQYFVLPKKPSQFNVLYDRQNIKSVETSSPGTHRMRIMYYQRKNLHFEFNLLEFIKTKFVNFKVRLHLSHKHLDLVFYNYSRGSLHNSRAAGFARENRSSRARAYARPISNKSVENFRRGVFKLKSTNLMRLKKERSGERTAAKRTSGNVEYQSMQFCKQSELKEAHLISEHDSHEDSAQVETEHEKLASHVNECQVVLRYNFLSTFDVYKEQYLLEFGYSFNSIFPVLQYILHHKLVKRLFQINHKRKDAVLKNNFFFNLGIFYDYIYCVYHFSPVVSRPNQRAHSSKSGSGCSSTI